MRHGVERIGDHDDDAVGRVLDDLFDDSFDDVVVGFEEIVAAHAGLARKTGGDDDDIAVGGAGIIAGRGGDAGGVSVGFGDGRGFDHVESFAGWRAIENVGKDDVGEFHVNDALRGSGADEAGADYGYFFSAHGVSSLALVLKIVGCCCEGRREIPRFARNDGLNLYDKETVKT